MMDPAQKGKPIRNGSDVLKLLTNTSSRLTGSLSLSVQAARRNRGELNRLRSTAAGVLQPPQLSQTRSAYSSVRTELHASKRGYVRV
jgi:hypothetical protein